VQRLIGYGLRLDAQLAVPGAVPDDRDGPADLSILRDPPQSTGDAPVYARTDAGLCFVCPGVASYRIAAQSIHVAPDPDARPDMITGMLVATALPAWLWLRGRFVLHAGAVRLSGGGAIAIAGASGSGKSTILAQLAAAGAAVIDQRCEGEGGLMRIDPVAAVAALLTHRHRPRVPALLGRTVEVLHDATLLAGTIPLYSWRRRAGVATLTPAEWAMLERIGMGKEIE
jgi:hypothetical protein